MNSNTKVSIITPTFNSENYIVKMLESIISQTYKNWELLITDDCSTDLTCKIIQNYKTKDSRIKLFKLSKNSGAGFARNNSIKSSTGRFIAFCDSDDFWFHNKLEKQIDFMLKENIQLTYSGYQEIDQNGNLGKVRKAIPFISYKHILRNNYIHCFTSIYDSSKLGKMYMPTIRKRQDWLLWINILKKIKFCRGISEPLGYYTIRKNSLSSNKLKLLKHNWNIYRKELNFNFIKSTYFIIQFLLFYLLKKNQ